jgi:hypothetical protein
MYGERKQRDRAPEEGRRRWKNGVARLDGQLTSHRTTLSTPSVVESVRCSSAPLPRLPSRFCLLCRRRVSDVFLFLSGWSATISLSSSQNLIIHSLSFPDDRNALLHRTWATTLTRSITAQTRDFYRGSGFKSPAEQLPEFRFTLPLIQPTRLKAAWPGRTVVWLI